MIYYNKPNNLKVRLINRNNINDWNTLYKLIVEFFPASFYKAVFKDVNSFANKHKLDDVLFLEKDNKIIGCALSKTKNYSFCDKDQLRNSLYLNYLIIKREEQGKSYGSFLLNSVIKHANKLGFEYVELINNINEKHLNKNIYMNNKFNIVHKDQLSDLIKTLYLRIDTNANYVNLSESIYKTYLDLKSAENIKVSEKEIIDSLKNNYVDIIKPKHISNSKLTELVNSHEFKGGVIGLKELIANKKLQPESVVSNFKVCKMLKTLTPYKKPITFLNNTTIDFEIAELNDIIRVFLNVTDKTTNQALKKTINEEFARKK